MKTLTESPSTTASRAAAPREGQEACADCGPISQTQSFADHLAQSPRQLAQRMAMLRMADAEEPAQGKLVAQRKGVEEEEPLQGRFENVTGRSVAIRRKVDPTTKVNGVPVNDNPSLEREADVMGAKAAQFVPSSEENEHPHGRLEKTPQTAGKNPNDTGIPDNLKAGIENLSGISMDGVKVHYNSSKPAQLNALAYAQGTDIHLGPGQEQHLPHEAWHVVQQGNASSTQAHAGSTCTHQTKAISPSANPGTGITEDKIQVTSHAHKHDSDGQGWPAANNSNLKKLLTSATHVIYNNGFYNIPLDNSGAITSTAGKNYLGFTKSGDTYTINHFGPFGEGPKGTATQL